MCGYIRNKSNPSLIKVPKEASGLGKPNPINARYAS